MRAFAVLALVAVASATAWNQIAAPSGGGAYAVAQIGPSPGQTSISADAFSKDYDVRDGVTVVSTVISDGTDFFAPYSGCFYQYNVPTGQETAYKFLAGPLCTTFSEYQPDGNLRSIQPSAVSLHLGSGGSSFAVSASGQKYTVSLKFTVDGGYAGVAFEFLDLNVVSPATPTDSDTRCGTPFDDLATLQNNVGTTLKYVSPHSGTASQQFAINNPAGHTYTAGHVSNGDWDLTPRTNSPTYSSGRTVDVTYSIDDFNNALHNCGWKRDETNQNTTLFKAQIRSTTVKQGRSIRGALWKSITETAVQIAIAFNTSVNATTAPIDAQSNITTYSQVIKQVFDPTSFTAYLLLYTSSQGPYQLEASGASCNSATGVGCQAWGKGLANGLDLTGTTNAINFHAWAAADVDPLKATTRQAALTGVTSIAGTGQPHRAKCWPADALTSATAPSEDNMGGDQTQGAPAFPVCGQFWTAILNVPSNCPNIFSSAASSTTLTLNADWKFDFTVRCHPTYTGSCATPLQNSVTVYANTASDNYCARIVDTVSASATLSVYQDLDRSQLQDQFVFGTTSFFTAEVTSTIGVEALYTEEVAITQGEAFDNQDGTTTITGVTGTFLKPDAALKRQIIYANGYDSTSATLVPDTYFGTVESAACAGLSGQNSLLSTGDNNGGRTTIPTGFSGTKCYFQSLKNPTGYKVTNWNIQQWNKNSVTGSGGTPVTVIQNYFQFQWDASTSNATGDFAQASTVRWLGRIRYDDAVHKYATLAASIVPNNRLETTSGSTASVSRLTSGAPSSSAPQEAAITTTTIAVAAAAVAAVAVMAVAAVVVLRSRNVKAEEETNLESVTLGSSTVNLAQ